MGSSVSPLYWIYGGVELAGVVFVREEQSEAKRLSVDVVFASWKLAGNGGTTLTHTPRHATPRIPRPSNFGECRSQATAFSLFGFSSIVWVS